jgi:hypothetical protein
VNGSVLHAAWGAEDDARVAPHVASSGSDRRAFALGGGHEDVDPNLGPTDGGSAGGVQEDVCRWDDAADVPVEVPLRPLLRALGLAQFADVFAEAGLLTSRDLHAASDRDLTDVVVDYADRHKPPPTRQGSAGAKSKLPAAETLLADDHELTMDERTALADAEVLAAAAAAAEAERLTLGHKQLLKLRTALHALGPRVHPGDNPTDLDDRAPDASAGLGTSRTGGSHTSGGSKGSSRSNRSRSGALDKSGLLNLGELPHHDKRVPVTQNRRLYAL